MIGRLEGMLVEKEPPLLLIDVNGVGYEVSSSMNTCYHLPEINQKVILHTHFVVREDAQLLYGFFDKEERMLFRALIKVNGVGPKLALALLSSLTPAEFARYVIDNNSAALIKLPGVGKKTAERLIIEMRDRLKDFIFTAPNSQSNGSGLSADINVNNNFLANRPEQDAVSGLIALGYKPQEASRAISSVAIEGLTSAEIIRKALQAR